MTNGKQLRGKQPGNHHLKFPVGSALITRHYRVQVAMHRKSTPPDFACVFSSRSAGRPVSPPWMSGHRHNPI